MSTVQYAVTGLTCQHCVAAVTDEVSRLDGVQQVEVELVAGGTSTLTVGTADQPVDTQALEAALGEAGDYRLVSQQ